MWKRWKIQRFSITCEHEWTPYGENISFLYMHDSRESPSFPIQQSKLDALILLYIYYAFWIWKKKWILHAISTQDENKLQAAMCLEL